MTSKLQEIKKEYYKLIDGETFPSLLVEDSYEEGCNAEFPESLYEIDPEKMRVFLQKACVEYAKSILPEKKICGDCNIQYNEEHRDWEGYCKCPDLSKRSCCLNKWDDIGHNNVIEEILSRIQQDEDGLSTNQ